MARRRTLARKVSAHGVALHAGVPAAIHLAPAPAGSGVLFLRTDLPSCAPVPALWSNVSETKLGTVLSGEDGASIAVVEHLLAALSGAEIDDCMVEVSGPELPAMEGDALAFLTLIDEAGLREQEGERPNLAARKEIAASLGEARAKLLPSQRFELHCEIDFSSSAIGRQSLEFVFTPECFRKEIAPARTFGFLEEGEKLRAMGYGRGANLENTLVIDKNKLVNPGLQRFPDEFVRHKVLDIIGDMALAGAPLLARYEGRRPSHALNNLLLRELFSDASNYQYVSG